MTSHSLSNSFVGPRKLLLAALVAVGALLPFALAVEDESTLNVGNQLSSLDFGKMIGGPVAAVVEAQGKAAMKSLEFIKATGFETNGQTKMQQFTYDVQDNSDVNDIKRVTRKMRVPLLTLIPIPFLLVNRCVVTFNAKIDKMYTDETETTYTKTQTHMTRWLWWSSYSTSIVEQKKKVDKTATNTTYTLMVRLSMVQDQMPGGMSKVLDILSEGLVVSAA